MRRQNNPNEFLLAIDGRHPTLLHFSDFKLVEDMFVLIGNLAHIGFLFFLRGSNDEEVVGMREAMACGKQFASIAQELERAIIVPTVGELHHAAGEVGLIHIDATVPNADKIERLRVGGPAVVVYIGVEGLADVTFLARSKGIDAEPVAVALVAIVLHALPGDVSSVRREFGVLIVAHILIFLLMVDGLVFETLSSIYGRLTIVGRLAEIHRLPRGRGVEEDVRVGGDRIGPTGFLATGIGDGFRVGTPGQLFHTAEGSHGAFVGLTLENVTPVVNAFGSNIGQEGVREGFDIVVPVAVHEIGNATTGGLRQVGGPGGNDTGVGDRLDEEYPSAVGREEESFDVDRAVGELSTVGSVGVHTPELTFGEEGDTLSAFYPGSIGFVVGGGSELTLTGSVGVGDVEYLVTFIFGHAVVTHTIDDFPSVGRGLRTAHAPHGPKGFGGHAVGLEGDVVFSNHCLRMGWRNGGEERQGCRDDGFLHRF